MLSGLLLGSSLGAQELPANVQAVLDRSRSTRTNYSVVVTAEVSWDENRWTETQAEFQQGPLHRVEVARTRVLANCDTGQTYVYDVRAGHLVDPPADTGACGVAINADQVISGRLLEPVIGPYGRADVIELTGVNFIRRYAVTGDGIIVATAYLPRRPDVHFSMRTVTVTVTRGRQNPEMFDPASLSRAFASAPPPPNNRPGQP